MHWSFLVLLSLQLWSALGRADTAPGSVDDFEYRYERYLSGADRDFEQSAVGGTPSTPDNFDNQELQQPRPILRIQSKVMDLPVGKSQKTITTYYAVISAYQTRFQRQNVEEPLAMRRVSLRSMADEPITIYAVNEDSGFWEEEELKPGQVRSFSTSIAGKFSFGIPSDGDLNDMSYIRLRMEEIPDGLWYILAPDINVLKSLQNLTPEEIRKTRGGVSILKSSRISDDDLKAGLAAANQLLPIMVYSEAAWAYRARTDESLTGQDTKIDMAGYRHYCHKHGKVHAHKSRKRKAEDEAEPEESQQERRVRRRLMKRDTVSSFVENHQVDQESWIAHQEPAFTEHPHWEFSTNNDGSFKFTTHTPDSIHARLAELSNSTVSDMVDQHRLFKRSLNVRTSDDEAEFLAAIKGDDTKSIIVTEEDSNLIVKIAKASGAIVRKIIDSVAAAFAAVKSIFERIKIQTEKLVQWLRAIFDWDSVLRTMKVSTVHFKKMPIWTAELVHHHGRAALEHVKGLRKNMMSALDHQITQLHSKGSFPEITAKMQNELFELQQEDPQQSFLEDYVTTNIQSPKTEMQCFKDNKLKGTDLTSVIDRVFNIVVKMAGATVDKSAILQYFDQEKLGKGMFQAAAASFLLDVRKYIMSTMHVAHEVSHIMMQEINSVLAVLSRSIHCSVYIPGVTQLWENVISKGTQRLSVISLMSLPGSLAFTVSYKAHFNGREPFDNDDVRALMTAERPQDYMTVWSECTRKKDCRSSDLLPMDKRFNSLTWLFASHKIVMGGMMALTEPSQSILRYIVPFKPVFQFMHHMASYPFPDSRSPQAYSVETWLYGLLPLAFLSANNAAKAGALEMIVRVPQVALSVLESHAAYKDAEEKLGGINPVSAVGWHWNLRSLSSIVNAMPVLPVIQASSLRAAPRLISMLMDTARLEIDMRTNLKF